jgi:hypothetical protein
MGLGPFDSFSFPDVYTRTLNEAPTATAAGDLRIPAFIGVADETIPIPNYEMIRGSSSMADNKITKENVSSQFTGSNRNFTVSYYPIVKGDGNGTTTTDTNNVIVYINNESVAVSSVHGTTGEIYLVNIPAVDDVVLCTYYFKKHDTLHTEEDLTDQVDGVRVIFRSHYVPIVQGDGGGITTTSTSHVIAKVNNVAVTVSAVDGDSGQVTLAVAPTVGQTLTLTYYSNEHQDTADILPSPWVSSLDKVGYSPGGSDFVDGVDFVLDTTGNFSTINWGHSYKVAAGQTTIGGKVFDDTQITGTSLFDNHNFRRAATGGSVDGTNAIFTMEATPKSGSGLGIDTDDPSLVTAFHGISPSDATVVDVIQLDAVAKSVVLATPPAVGESVYVTQYSNLLPDDTWTLTDTTSGASGVGIYSMEGANAGVAMDVLWSTTDTTVADPDFAAENVTYPNGTGPGSSDAQVMPGFAVLETVSLTFADATTYTVGSSNANGSGSGGDNTGYLNQTYIDTVTGLRVTVNQGNLVAYVPGDVLGYTVDSEFVTSSTPTRAIPGLRTRVANTTDIVVGDTATINTYNLSGAEPSIGDFYYVDFRESLQFDSEGLTKAVLYSQENLLLAATGGLTINNKLGLAGHLAFMNGTSAIALLQIEKTSGADDAPTSRYISGIDYFNEPMTGGVKPVLMEPLTTNTQVLAYLKTSNLIQSGIRYGNEHMSYFGFPNNTTPAAAQVYARAMNTERMTGIYPDGAVTSIVDELGNEVEYLVDGSFMAAAVAGRDTSPAFDVAEPLTRKPIVGFNRLFRRMDSVVSAQTANSGLTLFEETAAGIQIKFALTTDISSVLTRTPSVVRTKDFVQRGSRSILQPYIGRKNLVGRKSEIEKTLKSYLSALKTAHIITAYTGIKAEQDANDPTIINVVAYYSPVLPVLWIVITYNLRTNI